MNADCNRWIVYSNGTKKRVYCDTEIIGRFISTKAVGSNSRVDVTYNYKYPEGKGILTNYLLAITIISYWIFGARKLGWVTRFVWASLPFLQKECFISGFMYLAVSLLRHNTKYTLVPCTKVQNVIYTKKQAMKYVLLPKADKPSSCHTKTSSNRVHHVSQTVHREVIQINKC